MIAQGAGFSVPLTIERRVDQGPFQRGKIQLINRLFARLGSAAEVAARIGMNATTRLADSWSELGQPAAMLDSGARVLSMNKRFAALIGDGLSLCDGHLASWHSHANRALDAAVQRAVRYDGTLRETIRPVVLPRRNSRPLVAQLVPVTRSALARPTEPSRTTSPS